MSAPPLWFPYTEREHRLILRARTAREKAVLLAALLLAAEIRVPPPRVRFGRPLRRADVDELSGYSSRHVRIAFEQLELRLEVKRRFGRARKAPTAEFQLELPWEQTRIDGDPCSRINGDPSTRIDGDPCSRINGDPSTRIDGDPSSERAPYTDPSDLDPPCSEQPSCLPASRARVRARRRIGRQAGDRNFGLLEQLTRKLFPDPAIRTAWIPTYIDRMRELADDRTIARCLRYVASRHADEDFRGALNRLAVISKHERFRDWLDCDRLKSRAEEPRESRDRAEPLSDQERAEVRAQLLEWTSARTKP